MEKDKIKVGDWAVVRNKRLRDGQPMTNSLEILSVGKKVKLKTKYGNLLVSHDEVYQSFADQQYADAICSTAYKRHKKIQVKIDVLKKQQQLITDQIMLSK